MSGSAESTVLAALSAVVRDHGWLVTNNSARLRATLSDVLGPEADQHRGLIDAIVVSAEEGVPAEVRAAGRAGLADVAPELTERLTEWGMARERADWVVAAWGALLPEATLDPTIPPVVATPTQVPPVERATNPTPATEPTALPAGLTPHLAPTTLPDHTPPAAAVDATTGEPKPNRRRRRGLIIAVVTVLVLALGGVAAVVAMNTDDEPGSSASDDSDDEELPSASGSELVVMGSAAAGEVTAIPPVNMGGYQNAVSLVGLSPLTTLLGTDGERYAAPEGGSLVGFRLADGKCELSGRACKSWSEANLSVDIDGESQPLPRVYSLATATYALAIPGGASSASLVMKSDGRSQWISLLTGDPSSGNIAVLARDKRTWEPNKVFRTLERVNIDLIYYGDDESRTSNIRRGEVTEYSLHYWATRRVTASAADRALLRVATTYGYPQTAGPDDVWWWRSDEVAFRDEQNRSYRPIRMPGKKGSVWFDSEFYFDVPASVTSGTLLLGGSIDLEGTDGTPYTATTPINRIALRLS